MDDKKISQMRSVGFNTEMDNAEKNLCVFCRSDKTQPEDFKDDLSRKEFKISGMCQFCQDEIFG